MADAITDLQWARVHAKAWLDSNFKDTLDKNPAAALDPSVRTQLKIRLDAKLIDLKSASGYGVNFDNYKPDELQTIYTTGKLGGKLIEMTPSQWRSPSGNFQDVTQKDPGISLANWAKIYAYIWYQFKFASNGTIRDDFENKPAETLRDPTNNVKDQTVDNVNRLSPTVPKIDYIYQQTPLITHGDPPTEPGSPAGLKDIRDDEMDAKGYRYRVSYCC